MTEEGERFVCAPRAATRGTFVQMLVPTDIAAGWTGCSPWLLREQTPVRALLSKLRELLPFDLLA